MFDYLDDPRDRVVLGAAPTIMQPLYGKRPPCPVDSRRFLVAQDGLYLQARSPHLDALLRISESEIPLPYGAVHEYLRLPGGPLPHVLLAQILEQARAVLPREWACLVLRDDDGSYRLHVPEVFDHSAGHIRYATAGFDPAQVVLDLHTHGSGPAYFSSTDDLDDRLGGIWLSAVLGRVEQDQPEQAVRLVAYGHCVPLKLRLWQEPGRFVA